MSLLARCFWSVRVTVLGTLAKRSDLESSEIWLTPSEPRYSLNFWHRRFSPLALLHEFICAFEVTHSNAPPLFHLASGKWLISMGLARSKASTSSRSVKGTHISTLPLQTSQKASNVEFRHRGWPDLHVELSGNASIDTLNALSTCRLYFWFIDFYTYMNRRSDFCCGP